MGLTFTLNLTGGGSGLVNVGAMATERSVIALSVSILGFRRNTQHRKRQSAVYGRELFLGKHEQLSECYTASGIHFEPRSEPYALTALCAGVVSLPLLRLRRNKRA